MGGHRLAGVQPADLEPDQLVGLDGAERSTKRSRSVL